MDSNSDCDELMLSSVDEYSESESDDDTLNAARCWCSINLQALSPASPNFQFTSTPGISSAAKNFLGDSDDPMMFFSIFFDNAVMSFIMEETNIYAEDFFNKTDLTPLLQIKDEMDSQLAKHGEHGFLHADSEWSSVSEGFFNSWSFSNCYGTIDWKPVLIQAPPNCGSLFYNYKGRHSVALLALVNWDYSFIYIDVGCNGAVSEGGVFQRSLHRELEQQSLFGLDGCIVEDNAFPLKSYLMKPYKIHPLTNDEKIFNYMLSRARRVAENAFVLEF
ncbi:hypothetical protein HNY73_015243 [Argiope bruennichi]|uniref:DDE Tnp4 domain-containing protein n=1 Tax=Argiope bruennichi TaxID=94029 RepID=A0A8T0EWW2_ARGBR|nr:hypothetical protein HNY73_015243 [Argiope bruennichi]